jgi:hypothetical protein
MTFSHRITSYYNTSHHIISHYITSHHITSHHITLHHITSHHITSHHITLHHITSHHVTSHLNMNDSIRFALLVKINTDSVSASAEHRCRYVAIFRFQLVHYVNSCASGRVDHCTLTLFCQ